ncbi:hypothetical protein OIE62_40630 [Streptomyces scopuliridis]|uniref:Uncharacterized protein n=2 Tax=Streptomyces scopuliridis TaxID=452529 RepID=A0ACD4ZCE4_9ACTN|nr:hypothetical protein [Streptomyces scopuliridis]WSB95628.1 hypothetical protein OG835_00290 [Streptomyces scopuliridis]WSC10663.1 hypothetical protein OIE62_40630 [Streptomyces scopuliridis]
MTRSHRLRYCPEAPEYVSLLTVRLESPTTEKEMPEMDDQMFKKEPAFFPFVSAEIFFEAESDVDEIDFGNALDNELDEMLKISDSA